MIETTQTPSAPDSGSAPQSSAPLGGESSRRENVCCPFCGLACDDLALRLEGGAASVIANGCVRSAALFAALSAPAAAPPAIDGVPVALAQAYHRAAELLGGARQALVGGLASDVGGVRAALALADRLGAIVDHMNSGALMRNLLVLQDSGWIASTFAEVRTRADFVLVVGEQLTRRFPRFVERLLAPEDSPFVEGPLQRRIVCLGAAPEGLADARVIDCDRARVGEVFAALRCLVAGRPLQAERVGGVAIETLRSLAAEMQAARYGVVAWAAADLDFAHAELSIQMICGLVADLNARTRFAVLPLGGNDGDITANQVTLWQTGFPLRTGFGRGVPEYDPYHFGSERLLAAGEVDRLLWISSLDPQRLPPESSLPTIVLGSPAMRLAKPPAVFIPVATPGLHHAGHFFRSDGVMAVRLRQLSGQLSASPLPSVATAIGAIAEQLNPKVTAC